MCVLLSCLCCSFSLFPDTLLYLTRGNDEKRNISSPLINTKHQEWKCVRFIYYSGRKYFKRSLRLLERKKNITETTERWAIDRETDAWSYVQFPIAKNVEQVWLFGLLWFNRVAFCVYFVFILVSRIGLTNKQMKGWTIINNYYTTWLFWVHIWERIALVRNWTVVRTVSPKACIFFVQTKQAKYIY